LLFVDLDQFVPRLPHGGHPGRGVSAVRPRHEASSRRDIGATASGVPTGGSDG